MDLSLGLGVDQIGCKPGPGGGVSDPIAALAALVRYHSANKSAYSDVSKTLEIAAGATGLIRVWPDYSSQASDAVAPADGQRPAKSTTGSLFLEFDGTQSDVLVSSGVNHFVSGKQTLIIALNPSSNNASHALCTSSDAASSTKIMLYRTNTDFYLEVNPGKYKASFVDLVPAQNAWHIFFVELDPANRQVNMFKYSGGVLTASSNNPRTVTAWPASAADRFAIGSSFTSGSPSGFLYGSVSLLAITNEWIDANTKSNIGAFIEANGLVA